MVERLSCLSCGGKGRFYYICRDRWLDCRACNGTGSVMRDAAWVEQGERLRDARKAKGLSLGESADLLHARPSRLADAEFGRADPAPFLAAIERGVA